MRVLAAAGALCLIAAGQAAGSPNGAGISEAWPRPAGLEKDIAFWRYVYTGVSSSEGLLHDARHLEIVYETIELPAGGPASGADRQIESARQRYAAILKRLARESTGQLKPQESRVLGLFPDGVSSKRLATAAANIRFQRGQSDRFREGLERSGAWLPYIHQQLRASQLPPELAVLPHVESSFNAAAYSAAGAAGLWQITRATGRHYLRIDHIVDERLDPFASTRAALKILQQSHRLTGTWPLAVTAYNHGPGGLRRAKRKFGTSDVETIVRQYRSRSFGFASRNFYVAFLAANDVVRDAAGLFDGLDVAPPAVTRSVELKHYIPVDTLVRQLGVGKAQLKALNPALRRMVWEGDKRVPKGFRLVLPFSGTDYESLLAGIGDEQRFAAQVPDTVYKVRRGDTLSGIGKRYGLSASHIARANGLRSKHAIRIGQVLRLPPTDSGSNKAVLRATAAQGSYVVRSGDTLSAIAGRHGTTENHLAGINRLSNRHRIYPGQVLKLADASTASGAQSRKAE